MNLCSKSTTRISGNESHGLESVGNVIIILFAVLVIGYCIWILDKGFEITDESYYILVAIHASSQKVYVSAQHWISGWLWHLTGSLTMFRAAGMVALLLSSTILALGVFSICMRFKAVNTSFQAKWVVVASSVISAMLYASTINFSPSYNLLASAGAYAAAGLVLFATQCLTTLHKYTLYILAGCALGIEVLCKASAGVSTFIVLIAWLLAFDRSWFHRIWGAMSVATGAVAFSGIALLVNTSIGDAAQALAEGLQLFRIVQVEPIDSRLFRYATQFSLDILTTVFTFGLPIISLAIFAKTRRIFFAKLGIVLLILIIFFRGHHIGGWENGVSVMPPVAIVAMLIMTLVVSIPVWYKNRGLSFLFGGLIVLPYSVAMGTGNSLFTQIIVSLAPWGALIGLLVVAQFPKNFSKMAIALVGLCYIATLSSQIVTSGFRPYHMATPLIKQNLKFSLGNLGVVKVDERTYKFLTDLNAASKICNMVSGVPFLGLYNIPGVALALQVKPVLSPWLNNLAQATFVLKRTLPEELHSMVVALNLGDSLDISSLPPQLKHFTSNYRHCGTATYPFGNQKIQLWQQLGE